MSRKFHDPRQEGASREVGELLGLDDIQSICLFRPEGGAAELEVTMLITEAKADEIARILARHFAESSRPALHVAGPEPGGN